MKYPRKIRIIKRIPGVKVGTILILEHWDAGGDTYVDRSYVQPDFSGNRIDSYKWNINYPARVLTMSPEFYEEVE